MQYVKRLLKADRIMWEKTIKTFSHHDMSTTVRTSKRRIKQINEALSILEKYKNR